MMFAGVFVGVEVGLDNVVFVVVVECSVVLSFIGKSKYTDFSLSMETVSSFLWRLCLGCLSTTWKGPE